MGPSKFILFLILNLFCIIGSSSDYTNLVYKGCADQKFQDNGIYKLNLENLLETLISHSSTQKFYKTSSGDGPSVINGIIQCRGDLTNEDCKNCVLKVPEMAQKLCGQTQTVAARVQLNGCYLMYEIYGFRQVSRNELLYKVCKSIRASGAGFEDRLDMAFWKIVKSVESGNSGFFSGGYGSIYVLGQCEGDLSSGDYVKNAIDRAKSQCATSVSAQIYLQECYISYSYNPNGVAANKSQSSGTGSNTQKTVAIVLGGLATVGLGVACLLLFAKSTLKKKTCGYGV